MRIGLNGGAGTAVLQTYTAHAVLQFTRVAAAAWTMGRVV
jgi:hypothetical protein